MNRLLPKKMKQGKCLRHGPANPRGTSPWDLAAPAAACLPHRNCCLQSGAGFVEVWQRFGRPLPDFCLGARKLVGRAAGSE